MKAGISLRGTKKINKVVVAVNIPEVRGVSPEDEKKEGFVDTREVRE